MPKGHYQHKKIDPIPRFWSKVRKSKGCWIWTAAASGVGDYGYFWSGSAMVRAHRFSWELHNGPIPEGLKVLHACDVPLCVNPSHLFLGTMQDNSDDMVQKGRCRSDISKAREAIRTSITCKNGHEYTSENTYLGRGCRSCRTCARDRKRRWESKKEKIGAMV